MRKVLNFGCVISSVIAVAVHSPAMAQQAQRPTQATPETPPEEDQREIIVTAQRREERLADVPMSVSVVDADELIRTGATQFRDYADRVPGLSYNTTGAGYTQIVLRGVTTGFDVGATVAVYVDEVPYGGSAPNSGFARLAFDAGLFDLERIEVLRGPQGTLYGASAVGGLLKYVSRHPSSTELEGQVQGGLASTRHGGVSSNVAGVVNVPISEGRAGVRLSGFYNHDGGYIDNLALGRRDVNRGDIYGGRIDLLLTPTERFSVRLAAYAQNIYRNGENTADFTFAGLPSDGRLTIRRPIAEPFEQKFRLISATLNYDIGGADITSVSSYQSAATYFAYDISNQYIPVLETFFGRSYRGVGLYAEIDADKFVQELRVASNSGGRLEWVFGGFYTDEKAVFGGGFNLLDLNGQPALNDLFIGSTPSRFEEYAAFGTVTLRLTNSLDVSGGIRYAHNSQSFSTSGSGLLGTNIPLVRSSGNATTYLANARYRLTDRSIFYLRYATGYRPGGGNVPSFNLQTGQTVTPGPYRSDSLRSYEAGFRHESSDRRFSVDLSTYYIDWKDIIIRTFDPSTGVSKIDNEPPRVSRRLQPVRRRSCYGKPFDKVSGGGSGASSPAGFGSPG